MIKYNYTTAELRVTGDTEPYYKDQTNYTLYRKHNTHDIIDRNPEQHTITLSNETTINARDYFWKTPIEQSRPHPNPRAGFYTHYELIGFHKYKKGHRIILRTEEAI